MASAEALCFLVFFPDIDFVTSVLPPGKVLVRRSLDDDGVEVLEGMSSMFRTADTWSMRLRLPEEGLSTFAASRRSSSSASARDIVLLLSNERCDYQGHLGQLPIGQSGKSHLWGLVVFQSSSVSHEAFNKHSPYKVHFVFEGRESASVNTNQLL
jgi:hypothetical protein